MHDFPNPNEVFPNEYKTSCFIRNVITAPNIFVGDYTYYDDVDDPTGFERNNVLFNWPEFGDKLVIGRESVIMPGVRIGDGAIVAAYSVVTRDVAPYSVVGGNPARFVKKRFDDEMIDLLLRVRWWDFAPERLAETLPLLCDPDLDKVRRALRDMLAETE